MSGIRTRIEGWFRALADIIYDHRYKAALLVLAFVVALVSQIPKMTIDTSTEGFLHKTDPALLNYEKFRDQFGREQMLVIAIHPPDVFDPEFLRWLKALHYDLKENLPYLEDITSLINARNTRGQGDELIVEDLLENWPETAEELAAVKQRVRENKMYQNMLISEDLQYTTIVVQTQAYSQQGNEEAGDADFTEDDFLSDDSGSKTVSESAGSRKYLTEEENGEFVKAAEAILQKHQFPETTVYMAGLPAVSHFLKTNMVQDMRRFMAITVITIAVFLLILFRRLSGVFMPIIIVILSLLSTVGLMAVSGVAMKIPTQILPSFILAVGVGDSVHILVIFFRRFNRTGDKKEAIAYSMGHSGLAVLMTSLTTAGGLLSFSSAAVAPIADLGVFASAGAMLALLYTIILLPALLSIFPIKPKTVEKTTGESEAAASDRIFDWIGSLSIRYPWQILFVSSALVFLAVLGMLRIEFSHNPVKWLPADSDVRISNEKIDAVLKGTTSLEIIVDTGKKNGLYDPRILNKLEESTRFMEEEFHTEQVTVGKAWTITTVLKEINQALHGNDRQYYSVPQDSKLVAQEFLLFENSGSDDLEDVTDSQFSMARFTIKVPFIDAISYTEFITGVKNYFLKKYPEADVWETGMVSLFVQVITSAIISLRVSYLYAMVIITILMIFLIGRVRIGLLSMIPNLTPILIMLGIMGWFDISMNLFSMLVASISIGLAVDDTIHFMHNFRRYFEESNDAEKAVLDTLHSTGRAMSVTTCVLAIGFFTFMFASMKNLFDFGMLTGITISMALLADFFIAPSLMIVANRKKTN